MKTTSISDSEAKQLANGRVPARRDLDSVADLLTAYRSAAIGAAPRPSAALSDRLDLTATPIHMQRGAGMERGSEGAGARRTAGGLFGLGVTVVIILGAASGAAAAVSAGSAGLLPPGAQQAFDQVVSIFSPSGDAGQETTGEGEAPGVSGGTDEVGPEEAGIEGEAPAIVGNEGVDIVGPTDEPTPGTAPAKPATPGTPAEPAQPATPAEPAKPATPATPATPGNGGSGSSGSTDSGHPGQGPKGNSNPGTNGSGNSDSGNGNGNSGSNSGNGKSGADKPGKADKP